MQREYFVVVCLWRQPQKHLDLETKNSYAPKQRWSVGRLHEAWHFLCVFVSSVFSLPFHSLCVCVWAWTGFGALEVGCFLPFGLHTHGVNHTPAPGDLFGLFYKEAAGSQSLLHENREAQRQRLLSLALLGQNVSIALWDVPAKSQWLIPDTSFELQAWYRHMQFLGSESKEKKEGERITKHELLETGINYTQWFIGHDRSKRGMEVHHGKSSSSLIVERSVIEWESPQFAFQVKGHPAFYLKSDTGG